VAKSRWLGIQSVNRVFALTLTNHQRLGVRRHYRTARESKYRCAGKRLRRPEQRARLLLCSPLRLLSGRWRR
jgi:hypothetical protein